MTKNSKTKKIFLTFILFSILQVSSFVLIDILFFSNKVKDTTLQNTIKKNLERELVVKNFIKSSENTLYAIRSSYSFNNYLKNKTKTNRDILEHLFLTFSQSQTNFMQLRYINKQGIEEIRVQRDKENSLAFILSTSQLQDKNKRYYFEKSKEKELEKVWFSSLDLNIENGRLEIPYKETLRAILPIKKDGKFDGIIIINYFMKSFLKSLLHLPLYDAILTNSDGYTIKHYDKSKNWGFYKKDKFNIKQEFPKQYKQILSKDSFISDNFSSKKLEVPINNGLVLILKLKDEYLKKQQNQMLYQYIVVSTITFFLSLLASIFIVEKFSQILTQLEQKSKELQTIFDTSTQGIAVLDLDTKYLYFNQAYKDMLGFSEEELKNKTCLDLTAPQFKQKSLEIYKEVQKNGSYMNFERECIIKDGTIKKLNSSITLMPDKQTYLLTTSDNTELRRKERKIEEQNKILMIQSKMSSMSNFLINISHQWRQPLSIISSAISGLKVKFDLGYTTKEDIDYLNDLVIKNTAFLSKTIDDMNEFMQSDYSYEKFDLFAVIQNLITYNEIQCSSLNIEVIIECEESIEIYNTKDGLFQTLLNIMNNSQVALSKIDGRRLIFIEIKREEDYVLVKILDNGGGVDDKILENIFDPYFTTEHETQGKGMGLSVVHNIVYNSIKGKLRVKNRVFEYENKTYKGLDFKVEIPIDLLKS